MSRAAPTPPPADLTGVQLAQLARLAEIGMEIAEAAGRQARGLAQGEAAGADPALSFSRAARAVRLTIALQQRLVGERAASGREEAARRRDRIHTRVERRLEQVAEAEGGDADAVEHLSLAAWERLTETDDDELLGRPIEEVVAQICADLGLSAGWAASAFGPSLPEGPLSHPAGDSSPVNGGAGQGAASILLPCPAEDGGGGPEGRRWRGGPRSPRPWRMSG